MALLQICKKLFNLKVCFGLFISFAVTLEIETQNFPSLWNANYLVQFSILFMSAGFGILRVNCGHG